MTWHNAQIHNVALPVGDQECHRDLNISWKTDSKLSLSAVLLREYIVDHFWEFVRDNANKTFPMQKRPPGRLEVFFIALTRMTDPI